MSNKSSNRVTACLTDDDFERVKYWAEKKGMSINDFVRYSIDLAIKRENKDYDLPSLEAARLNQIIDALNALTFNTAALENIVTSGFDSLLRLTRGENYLLDDDAE